jgi:hypothetical protein
MAASPTIESESVSHITVSDATLEAHLNTVAVEEPGADYQFEVATSPSQLAPEFTCPTQGFPHGTSLCLGVPEKQGSLPIHAPPSAAERGKTGLLVTEDANADTDGLALAPNTTYYYRVVAAQAVRTEDTISWVKPAVDGTTQSFTTTPPQHWYRNNTILAQGNVVPVVMFGGKVNLSQQSALGEINCRGTSGGVIDNPAGGGAGEGKSNTGGFYECKAPECEAMVKEKTGLEGRGAVTTQNNPGATKEPAFPGWTNVLEESEVAGVSSVREKVGEPFETFKTPSPPGMIRETVDCTLAANQMVVAEAIHEGELKPEIGIAKAGNLNGTTAAKPSTFKFSGASTGCLNVAANRSCALGGQDTFTGSLKYLGYDEQELITVKP